LECPKRLRKLRSFLWFMHELSSMGSRSVRLGHIAQEIKEAYEQAGMAVHVEIAKPVEE